MDELPVSTKCEFTFYTKPTSSVTRPTTKGRLPWGPSAHFSLSPKSLFIVSNKLQTLVTSPEELSPGLCVLYSAGTLVFNINGKTYQ